jgi:hypothetical protein
MGQVLQSVVCKTKPLKRASLSLSLLNKAIVFANFKEPRRRLPVRLLQADECSAKAFCVQVVAFVGLFIKCRHLMWAPRIASPINGLFRVLKIDRLKITGLRKLDIGYLELSARRTRSTLGPRLSMLPQLLPDHLKRTRSLNQSISPAFNFKAAL